jgi:ABC-type glycerol-3-phosphate transport system substrate-binding protein
MLARQSNQLSVLLCLLTVVGLLLNACTANTAPTAVATDAGVTYQPSELPTVTAAAPAADGDSVNSDAHPIITFAADEYQRTLFEPLIEQFNSQHPEMTVQFAALPQYSGGDDEAFQDYYRTQASTGDTLLLWSVAYAPGSYFRDMQALMETDPTFEPDDFWPNALQFCQDAEGRQLGVPLSFSVNGIFYDKAAFDEAGLPYPKPGWTLDEFQQTIAALARQEGGETRYGLAENYSQLLGVFIEIALDANDGELTAETIQPAVEWYINLAKAKAIYTPPYAEEDNEVDWNKKWQAWQDLFKGENRPVMWVGGLSESLPGAEFYGPSEDDPFKGLALKTEGFAPYPLAPEADNTSQVWGQCAAISAGSRNPRAAWTWLNFLSHQRLVQDQSYAWELVQLPARISLAESSGYWQKLPAEVSETVRFAIEHAWPGSSYTDRAYQVYNAVQKLIAGKTADLATALADVQEQMASTAPTPTPNPDPIVVATPKPTLSPDSTAVDYFYQAWGPDSEALRAVVDEYNKTHADSPVTLRTEFNFSSGSYEEYQAAIANEFDCYTSYAGGMDGGYTLPLDTFLEAEGPEFLQDFDPAMLDVFRQDGKLLGLPAVSQPQLIGYNADLLARRGLEPPAAEWTFDDFIELATRAASTDEADRSYGFISSEWDTFLLEGRGIVGADYKSDPPAAHFDSPEFANGLAWLNDLLQAGMLLTQTNDNYMDVQTAMQEGRVAFWVAQAGQPGGWFVDQFNPPSYAIGVAPLPAIENPAAATTNWANDQAHYISTSSSNPQACWDWIKYLSEQPTAFNGIPARRSVQNSPAWAAQVGEEYVEVYKLALSQTKRISVDDQEALFTPISWPLRTWQQAIVSALFKGEDTAKAIATAQQRADDYLACMAAVETDGMESNAVQKEVYRCVLQADPEGDWSWLNNE